jgi:hypothetical protein
MSLTTQDAIDYDKLALAVAAHRADYDELCSISEIPGWITAHYDYLHFVNMDSITSRRQAIRFLVAKTDVEIHAKSMDDAIKTESIMLKLSELFHHGGFAVDFLVAKACENITYGQIHKSIDLFDRQQCDAMQRILTAFESRRRGIDDVLYREQVFMQRNMGWPGHVSEYIERIRGDSPRDWNVYQSVRDVHCRAQSLERLLRLKLAIRAYRLDHGSLPQELSQLVPAYLSAVPIDPYDPLRKPLRYRIYDDSFLVYSVSKDGKDDGGRPQKKDIGFPPFHDESEPAGDLSLDDWFAPDEEPEANIANGPS